MNRSIRPARPHLLAGTTLIVLLMSAIPGCHKEPSRWEEVQKETRGQKAVAREALPGGEFNVVFPKGEGDYSVIYTQEKRGFAEADLKEKGETLATLSVFDTASNPEAAEKYRDAVSEVRGYPMINVGENGNALLVGGRFQVQVRSKDANFDKPSRVQWLEKFDLANLERLAKAQ